MQFLDRLRAYLRVVVPRKRIQRDIDREMAFHLDRETERLVGSGVSPQEAHRIAAVRFGGRQRFRDETREAASSFLQKFLDEIVRDIR